MSTMPTITPPVSNGPMPLLIGVTGHRDLRAEDFPKLEAGIRHVFEELLKQYPQTPLLLLSPLAEGVDRLTARVALQLGVRLQVPLPLPLDLYVADFETEESRCEFQRLLETAEYWFEMPLVNGHTEDDVRQPGPARNRQYEAVGDFIAQHSQILLALWDGAPSEHVGGTAQTIHRRLTVLAQSSATLLYPPDPVHGGPVYQIVSPRRSNSQPAHAFALIKHFPEGLRHDSLPEETYRQIYGRTNRFNADAAQRDAHLAKQRGKSKNYLLPDAEAERLPLPLRFTRECFAVADSLALFYQQRTLRSLIGLFFLVFLAVAVFEICLHLLDEAALGLFGHPLGLGAALGLLSYPLVLGVAYVVFLWARWNDYQNKYQDYRALAEGLRVQFFWRLGGLTTAVDTNYLRRQRSELHWIRNGVRVCWSLQGGEFDTVSGPATPEESARRLQLVQRHWVDDQQKFFVRRAHREEMKNERIERVIKVSLYAGLGLALLGGGLVTFPNPVGAMLRHTIEENKWLEGLFVVLTGLPMFGAALLHAFGVKLAVAEHARKAKVMEEMFTNAQNRLKTLVDSSPSDEVCRREVQALLEELGKEALVENGDWVLLHRERPLEVPHGR